MTAFEKLTIETPEQIALEFTLASAGSRFLALAVDSSIQIGLLLLVLLATVLLIGAAGMSTGSIAALGPWTLAFAILAGFTVIYGYFALFEWQWRGQTPGKRLLGLRVIAATGHPMTPYQAAVRNLLRIVDQVPALYGIGLTTVLLTERNQRLGDLAAGTVVVREETASRHLTGAGSRSADAGHGAGTGRGLGLGLGTSGQDPRDATQGSAADGASSRDAGTDPAGNPSNPGNPSEPRRGMPAPGAPDRTRLGAARLDAQELQLIERFLDRRTDLDWHVRERTAQQIAARIRQRLGLPADGPDEDLLLRIVSEARGDR